MHKTELFDKESPWYKDMQAQFCIDELTALMQNREGTAYIPN